ncbi:hypothetical protein [Altibacter sp.]|uniref:type I restriction enzyme endonuclease domain-containing protein n=1 Tax=Altibacter sp. TaxID=2024823 RepID=UPI002582C0EE|nr:hypothetical protein [Altibacter sp.]MCW9038391.1 hypothetical protein [Altibacter sp.]
MENEITPEIDRAINEGLDEETLAIFDLLKKSNLTPKEEEKVKKVAIKTLEALKKEKLKIDRWRESTQVTSQVKTIINDGLQYLPEKPYPNEELDEKSILVYQHIYTNYQGDGISTYGVF